MQFNFDCVQSLGCDPNGISILEGSYQNKIVPGYTLFVNEILNSMGEASSKAQNLPTIITTADKFFSSNHRIVIKAEGNKVLGFIKVGNKRLFLRDRNYNYHEVYPLCVLDFYVHESIQRKGIGKQLFDHMLNFENKNAKELAYDRPSNKLLNFLKKYFGLDNFIKQSNNFVVFDDFFDLISENTNLIYDNETNRVLNNFVAPFNNNYPNKLSNFSKLSPTPFGDNKRNLLHKKNEFSKKASSLGEKLVYSNSSPNIQTNIYNNKIINKEVYSQPNTGFKNYYLNNEMTNAYDNIYSRRKLSLINDYLSSKKQSPYEYVKDQINIKEQSISNSNDRLNELMNKISDIRSVNRYKNEDLFNKRNNYATIFDDKKLVEHNYMNQQIINNYNYINDQEFQNYQKNHIINGKKSPQVLQHYTPFSQLGKVYTNVLPKSSQAYGAYYNQKNFIKNEQTPNRIYY